MISRARASDADAGDVRASAEHAGDAATTTTATPSWRAHRFTIGCCLFVVFLQWFLMTLMPAFFDGSGPGGSLSTAKQGLVFAAFPAGAMVGSPAVGWAIPRRLRPKKAIVLGLVFMCVFAAMFGAAPSLIGDYASHAGQGTLFAWFLTLAFCYGVSSTVAETAAYAVCLTLAGDRRGAMVAAGEVAAALGTMLGPLAGGAVFALASAKGARLSPAGAFLVPFAGAACLPLLCAGVLQRKLPANVEGTDEFAEHGDGDGGDSDPAPPVPLCALLRDRTSCFALAALFCSATSFGAAQSTLALRLAEAPLCMAALEVGTVYFASSLVYVAVSAALGGVADGMLADKGKDGDQDTNEGGAQLLLGDRDGGQGGANNGGGELDGGRRAAFLFPQGLILAGLGLTAVAFALLGPAYVRGAVDVPWRGSPFLVYFASCVWGVASGLITILSLPLMLARAPDRRLGTASSVTGLWMAAYSGGFAAGPVIGSGLLTLDAPALCRARDDGAVGAQCPKKKAHQHQHPQHPQHHCFDGMSTLLSGALLLFVAVWVACLGFDRVARARRRQK